MAITAFKTFAAFEVLTASDLNASFSQIINNPIDLWAPMTKNAAAGGFKFTGLGVGAASGEALTYGQALVGSTLALTGATTGGTTAAYSGNVTIGGSITVGTTATITGDLSAAKGTFSNTVALAQSLSGSTVQLNAQNTSNTANSHFRMLTAVGGSSAGDCYMIQSTQATDWSLGVDNSNSDLWCLSSGGAPGTGDQITVHPSTGLVTLTGAISVGGAATVTGALTVTGATTLNGNVTLGDAAGDTITVTGTVAAITVSGAATMNGNVTLGDAAADTITVNGTPAGKIVSGTYTPTITTVLNIASSSTANSLFNYMRIGDIVHVAGFFELDATSSATSSEVGISLPIASDFATTFKDCSGVGIEDGEASVVTATTAIVIADTTNNRAAMKWRSGTNIDGVGWCVVFQYRVL